MSILDRINLLVRSEISDIGRGRGPMKEMESSLRDAKRQQIELRRNEKRLIEQIREARAKVDRWEDRAVLALKNGDEELAREALIMKNKALGDADRLRDELDELRAYQKDITRALEALEVKLQGTRGRMENSRSSSSGDTRSESGWDAEMRRRMRDKDGGSSSAPRSSTASGSSSSSSDEDVSGEESERTFRAFDRMASKINEMEASIEAMRDLSLDDVIDPRKRELEEIFGKMEKKKKTDDDLADLKKKFSD